MNTEIKCSNCDELETKLREVLLELNSTQLIIKLLQREICTSPGNVSDQDCRREASSRIQSSKLTINHSTGTQAGRYQRSSHHFENSRRYAECAILPTTNHIEVSNRFEVLPLFKDTSSGSRSSVTIQPAGVDGEERVIKKARRKKLLKEDSKHLPPQHILKNVNKAGPQHRIIILGDSHARDCANEVQQNVGSGFEVQ
jgi:hypothetical protein